MPPSEEERKPTSPLGDGVSRGGGRCWPLGVVPVAAAGTTRRRLGTWPACSILFKFTFFLIFFDYLYALTSAVPLKRNLETIFSSSRSGSTAGAQAERLRRLKMTQLLALAVLLASTCTMW